MASPEDSDRDGWLSDFKREVGDLTILYGNTELLVTVAVCGLMRLVAKDSARGDVAGEAIAPFLDIGRRADLVVKLADKFVEDGALRDTFREWRRSFRDVSERRNRLLHGAWMIATREHQVFSLRVKRGGDVDTQEDALNAVKALQKDIKSCNQALTTALGDAGVLPLASPAGEGVGDSYSPCAS